VFADLDGVALGATKRDGKAARAFFDAYVRDMPRLILLIE